MDLAEFQDDMLMQIAECMPSVEDFSKFSCVSHQWQRASYACDMLKLRKTWALHQMPWLMLTDGNHDENVAWRIQNQVDCIAFFDENRYFNDNRSNIRRRGRHEMNDSCCQRNVLNLSQSRIKCYNLNLHEINERVCWGSQYGWVVTLGLDRDMFLYNPLTKVKLPLPSQTTLPSASEWSKADDDVVRNLFIWKAVLVKVPKKYVCDYSTLNEACICDDGNSIWLVVAIYNFQGFVSIAKPGDRAWIPLEVDKPPSYDHTDRLQFTDVLFWPSMNSLLFIKADFAELYSCDIQDIERPQMLRHYLNGPPNACKAEVGVLVVYFFYLVEFMGDIFLITKECELLKKSLYLEYKSLYFGVYKLDMLTRNWNKVQDLQDVGVFLGSNVSMAISAKDGGCRGNCIYFCDDARRWYLRTEGEAGGHDMGIFNMSSRTIEPLYTGFDSRSKSSYCCPFWFSPSI